MSKIRFTVFKYINPETEEHYMTITEEYDEVYDGPWYDNENEKIIEIRLKPSDNYLNGDEQNRDSNI